MPKSTTPSFVLELPLKTTPQDERILKTRLEATRALYNACLSHCLKQIRRMKQSRLWTQAKHCKNKAQRGVYFRQAIQLVDFSEYALHAFASALTKQAWFQSHLDAFTIQKTATRAFKATQEYLLGKRGKPRFKGKSRFRSIEGKSNRSGIRFKDGIVLWNVKGGKPLKLEPLYDRKDKHGVESHGLNQETKYVRLLKKTIKGQTRWYVQLIQKGQPQLKVPSIPEQVVGIDVGPSTIAIVSEEEAHLKGFCEELELKEQAIKAFQKQMERSRRLTNPQNYKADGTVKAGPKVWHQSKRYQDLKTQLSELSRQLRETRKCLHGRLSNQVLSMGKYIQCEKLSYRSFQKNYGRSVGNRAPGLFLSMLRRKAESAGGEVVEFSPYQTKLSQSCHCGRVKKKSLSERWHRCACGVVAQRDLYSAYLARYVSDDCLDTNQAKSAWSAGEALLGRAVSRLREQASGVKHASFGLGQRESLSHVKEESSVVEAVDVVPEQRVVLGRATEKLLTCP